MNPMNKHLTPEQIANHDEAVALRRRLKIPSPIVAKAMGYKNESSVGDIETLRYCYPAERIASYAAAVRKIADGLQQSSASSGRIAALRMPTVTAPVDAELLAKFRERRHIRKSSGTYLRSLTLEMEAILGEPVSTGMIAHFEHERTLNPARAIAYIAAVDNICRSSQIPMPNPLTEPTLLTDPTQTPTPHEGSFALASIAELVAIINRCNEELRRHRAAVSASFGRPISDATWNAIVADVTTP